MQYTKFKSQNRNSRHRVELKYRCYLFSVNIIQFAASLPEKKIYWIVTDQLVRSATSIGANVVEARSASSRRDFIKFYEIALKSANETKYWLGLLRDADLADKSVINGFLSEADEIARILGSSVLTLKNKKDKF